MTNKRGFLPKRKTRSGLTVHQDQETKREREKERKKCDHKRQKERHRNRMTQLIEEMQETFLGVCVWFHD